MSRDRHVPDDDEITTFRQALREAGVRPIASNRADPGRRRRGDVA
ncbi:MAG: DNA mismatch repair protein MutS, partial [Halomonas sp.]|nr:DNA mismatch repair protein MutS [Halomonas sp.]